MRKMTLALVLSALSLTSFAHTTILNHVTIIDGSKRPVINNGALVIEGKIVKKVLAKPVAHAPVNAVVLDLTGKTIMPTLIAAHAHLGLVSGITTSDANNTPENVRAQLKKYAQYGVGTVLSLGRDQTFIYELRKELPASYPLVLTAGQGFGVPVGMPPALNKGIDPVYRPKTAAEVPAAMSQLAKNKPNIVKLWLDNWYGTMQKMQPDIYQAIIKSAHQHHLPVVGHIYYLDDAKALAKAGINILGHSVRDKLVDKEFIALMKKNHVAYIPTLQLDEAYFVYQEKPQWMMTPFFKNALQPHVWQQLMDSSYPIKPEEKEALKIAQQNLKTLYDENIPIAFGTDSGATPTRAQGFAEHRELQLMVQAGLPNAAALHIATGGTAHILGIDNKIGVLKPGNVASFIILNSNPLQDIRNTEKIHAVWLEGVKVDGSIE